MERTSPWSLCLWGLLVCAVALGPSIAAGDAVDTRLDDPPTNQTPATNGTDSPEDNDTASTEIEDSLGTGSQAASSQAASASPGAGGAGLGIGWALALGVTGLAAVGAGRALHARRPNRESSKAHREARENPGPEGAMILGQESLDEGELQAAEAWFQTARELEPSLSIAALCQGLCHLEMGNLSRARELLAEAVRRDLGDGTARYHLARAQALDGAIVEAARTIRPLVEVKPDVVEDLLADPELQALRDDPRWLAALDEL